MNSHEPQSYLEDYDIIEEISRHRDGVSINYLAKCKRGRLRNRNVALKKSVLDVTSGVPSSASPPTCLSDLIHQTLYHPNVASLYHVFYTPSARYHVLELCSGGSLADLIRSKDPPRLLERELPGVTKTLIDALVYLKKELIVHRDLNLSNILLTGDYTIKLAGFGCAVRLSFLDSSSKVFSGSPEFPAPEMAAERPYNFSVDLWSLGCVMVTCLSGLGITLSTQSSGLLNAIPKNTTDEGKSLLSGLLQTDPDNRIPLVGIISHPFFANSPFVPLGSSEEKSDPAISRYLPRQSSLNLPPFPPSSRCLPKRGRRSCSPVIYPFHPAQGRPVLSDIRNLSPSDLDVDVDIYGPTRRVVSDPIPSTRNAFPSRPLGNRCQTDENTSLDSRPLWRDIIKPDQWFGGKTTTRKDEGMPRGDDKNDGTPQVPRNCDEISPINLPIGTTRPQPLSTALLNPQTHKSMSGNVTVLPSRSLLVDFRESQRRKHYAGNEILIISPDGKEIGVYSAPHLSLPACLAEPNHEFTIQTLPTRYWKQYNDAYILIEQIKQRTPKMVLYTDKAKCVLMANGPRGDIELLFRHPPPANKTLEIAEFVVGTTGGGEWTKRVLTPVQKNLGLTSLDWATLNSIQKEAISQASLFLRACESVECLPDYTISPAASGYEVMSEIRRGRSRKTIEPQTIANSFGTVKVATRPKLSMAAVSRPNSETGTIFVTGAGAGSTILDPPTRPKSQEPKPVNAMDLGPFAMEYDEIEITGINHRVQTRFIQSVSQGGRYRIMFIDGAELDIDVDEEWAEYISPSGETTRHNIRDLFEEFVSMFEDG
ncbi:kinase-like domain-containing protein [Infundibulicybe gibba]|nr:kinase-like domain-containing protein [Infundibulicybe gibba]